MELIWQFGEAYLLPLVPTLLVLAIASLVFRWVSRRHHRGKQHGTRFSDQLLGFFVLLASVVCVLLTLPIESATRGQLLTLLGLLLTAVVTLSSSTIAANAMAGVMLRSLRSFEAGDFISVGEHFGRVTEQDLFHTEIQTQDRDLLTLPNLYLATNPVKVVHQTGTIVSAEVSLGYDVDQHRVEKLLIEAAEDAELAEPFIYVLELGDHAISYRVSGFLQNVKHLLSSRSGLRKKMLARLHADGVEIVSPSFMNQRAVEQKVIPVRSAAQPAAEKRPEPEKIIFDKAERAQEIKDLQASYEDIKQEKLELQKSSDDDADSAVVKAKVERLDRRMKAIRRVLEVLDEKNKSG